MCKIIKILKAGGIGVMPTDTIYGIVGRALDKKAVERIYKLKKRSPNNPFLILISDIQDLSLFGVKMYKVLPHTFCDFWPGHITIVLPCPNLPKRLSYLKPLNATLAFRLPKPKWLRRILAESGPLVAPSANPKGQNPAKNIREAKAYFGKGVDFYWDKSLLVGKPSTIIKIDNGKIQILRQGSFSIHQGRREK